LSLLFSRSAHLGLFHCALLLRLLSRLLSRLSALLGHRTALSSSGLCALSLRPLLGFDRVSCALGSRLSLPRSRLRYGA
jgi:hypothetical protein